METKYYLVWIAISFAVFGFLEAAVDPDLVIIHMILLAILGFGWCKEDVRSRLIVEPPGSALLVAAIAVLGVPLYLFRSRPAKKAWVGLFKCVGFLLACSGAYAAAYFIAESTLY
ncbi:MAG: hypothetical protein AAFQ62_15855 [Pseudomonadota bacterium]